MDLNTADRAASVGGREAAHGHVASLQPYRLSAGSRCAEQPKPARQRDLARMVSPRSSRPTGRTTRPRVARAQAERLARPSDRSARARVRAGPRCRRARSRRRWCGPLALVSRLRARWAPSMRRVRDFAVVMVAWVVMALPGRPKRNRERSNGSIALPGLPGRHVVTGSSRSRSGNSPRVVSTIPRRCAALVFAASGHGPCVPPPPREDPRWMRSSS